MRVVSVAITNRPDSSFPDYLGGLKIRLSHFEMNNGMTRTLEFTRTLEDFLRLPWGSVVYYDGRSFRVAADGIPYANGINVRPRTSITRNGEISPARRLTL